MIMYKEITDSSSPPIIVKQLGHEDLFQFAERVVKDLSEKSDETIIMDCCGEGIMVVAYGKSTIDSIIADFEKEFEEGFCSRYEQFLAQTRRRKSCRG